MPRIKKKALELVGHDKKLLANTPDLIVNQPIEFTAPEADRIIWYSTGREEIYKATRSAIEFIDSWTLPLLNNMTSLIDLIMLYENNDNRIMKQKHWYVFVASSYCLENYRDKALNVLQDNLNTAVLKKRYSVAFDVLGVE